MRTDREVPAAHKRLWFLAAFLALLGIEIFIGVCVHDNFVRPYLGDTLVVMLLWAAVRIAFPQGLPWLSGAVFVFACLVEISQLIPLCDLLGIRNNLIRVLMGTSFAWGDVAAYAAGCLATAGHDLVNARRESKL